MTTLGDNDNLSIRLSNILPAGYVSAYTHDLQGASEILGYGIVQTTLLLGPESDGHFWLSGTYPDETTHDVSIHVIVDKCARLLPDYCITKECQLHIYDSTIGHNSPRLHYCNTILK